MKKLYLVLVLCLIGVWWHWQERPVVHGPGVLAPSEPWQKNTRGKAAQFQKEDYDIEVLASFSLEARVILKEDYRFDAGAALSPVDLALGWGRMSDSEVLAYFDFSQRNRFYYWQVNEFPIPRREIESSSANMHMIPATPTVERRLKEIRPGNIVKLEGYLVEARRDDGWRWRSSLTRNDTGDGACELVWVESLKIY